MGNQTETAVAINPTNPKNVFTVSNNGGGGSLFGGVSFDGGATWTTRTVATGGDGLSSACCDPSVSWDQFGNLFLTYINSSINAVIVAVSSDGGQNFTQIASFGGGIDQPTIVTGPGNAPGTGSVWVSYNLSGSMVARGALVTGLGTANVGSFSAAETAPNSGGGNFGDIAVGPNGQVIISYEYPSSGQGPATIFGNLDPDGLGPQGFGPQLTLTTTNVGGFDYIPAQPSRSVDAEAGFAWDRTGGPHNGRLYMVYTDEFPDESNNTDIFVRYSDNNGTSWSSPVKVNDDNTTNSQFLPRIAIDQTTGDIAVSFYDARNSPTNTSVQFFASVSTDGGLTFLPNVQVSSGISPTPNDGFDFGDYTGLDFRDGTFIPAWGDSSNSTADNPGGLDLYTNRVQVRPGYRGYMVRPADGQTVTNLDFGNRQITALSTVDNGTYPFRITGPGWTTQTGAGYQNNYSVHADGVSEIDSNTARWSIQRTPGTYEVFVTWVARPQNANDASYKVYDGPTLIGTFTVNQQVAPEDLTTGGVSWKSLGVYSINTTVLSVVLSSIATGDVVADAAMLASPPSRTRVPLAQNGPIILVPMTGPIASPSLGTSSGGGTGDGGLGLSGQRTRPGGSGTTVADVLSTSPVANPSRAVDWIFQEMETGASMAESLLVGSDGGTPTATTTLAEGWLSDLMRNGEASLLDRQGRRASADSAPGTKSA